MNSLETALKAKKGDKEAFGVLIREHKDDFYRIAYSYVKNKEDALDIVHDAICKAFVSIRSLKQPQYFNTWFTRILINCALDHLKKAKRTLPLANHNLVTTGHGPDDLERLDLYDAIDKLEARQKSVIILKYLHDMTLTDVSDVLKCPLGTVKTLLHKALLELRLELKEGF